MVVADAGPLHYLILIGAIDVLEPLYSRVLLPRAVSSELLAANAPHPVHDWMAHRPAWCEIRPDPPPDPALGFLDAGEHAAIALALSVHAHGLLIDERAGRAEAERRQLQVTGTVGALAEAHCAGLLDFETAVCRLRKKTSISRKMFSGLCASGCREITVRERFECVKEQRAVCILSGRFRVG